MRGVSSRDAGGWGKIRLKLHTCEVLVFSQGRNSPPSSQSTVQYSYVPSLLPVIVRKDVLGSVDSDVFSLNYFHADVIK